MICHRRELESSAKVAKSWLRQTRCRMQCADDWKTGGPPEVMATLLIRRQRPSYLAFGRGAGLGPPMVAGAFSGIHFIALRSYLYPWAFCNASFVVFMTGYQLLLSFFLNRTASKGTATSFSPIPRNPPTPMIIATFLPS